MADILSAETKFISGKTGKGKWTGIFVAPPGIQRTEEYGKLYVVINLSAPQDFDSRAAGDLLLENIQDVYYEKKEGVNVITRIERSIMSTAKRLEYLLEREDVAAEEGIDLNIQALVMLNDFVYMAVLGEGAVMLQRKGNLINLTEGLKDLTGRNLIRSGSGRYERDDKFILLSSSAITSLNEKKVEEVLSDFDLSSLEEQESDPLFAVLAIEVKSEDEIDDSALIGEREDSDSDKKASVLKSKGDKIAKEDEKLSEDGEDMDEEKPTKSAKDEDNVGTQKLDNKDSKKKEKLNEIKDKLKGKLSDKKTYQVILMRIKDFFIKIFKLAKMYIWEDLLGMKKGGDYLRGAGPKPSVRGIIILILLVASLLFLSIQGISKHKETSDKKDEVRGILASLDEKFDNGRNLGTAGNIEEAVKILEEAYQQIQDAKEEGVMTEELEAKEKELLAIMDDVQRVIVVTDDDIITDIGGFIEGATGDDFTLWQTKLYIVDSNMSAIYETNIDGGEVMYFITENSSLASPSSLVIDSTGSMLVYDREKGILKVNMEEKTVEQLTGLSEATVGEVQEVENYQLPNDGPDVLYILKSANNSEVRKVMKTATGYTMPELRLADLRLAAAKDLEIDGKIYVLTNSDGVLRFWEKTADPYTLVGLDKPIDGSTCLELDDELVFLGDSVNRRVAIVTKSTTVADHQGKYVAQIKYRGEGDYLGDIKEIIVDNEARLMFILDGTRIFKVVLDKVDEYHGQVR